MKLQSAFIEHAAHVRSSSLLFAKKSAAPYNRQKLSAIVLLNNFTFFIFGRIIYTTQLLDKRNLISGFLLHRSGSRFSDGQFFICARNFSFMSSYTFSAQILRFFEFNFVCTFPLHSTPSFIGSCLYARETMEFLFCVSRI